VGPCRPHQRINLLRLAGPGKGEVLRLAAGLEAAEILAPLLPARSIKGNRAGDIICRLETQAGWVFVVTSR
jgi:hypothetical protein